jgi:hypothetical protein
VFRRLSLLAACAGVLAPWAQVRAQDQAQPQSQDQPSVADAARQARQNKDKGATQPKRVFTDDDMGQNHAGAGGTGLSGAASAVRPSSSASKGSGQTAGSSSFKTSSKTSNGDSSPMGQALAGIDRAEDSLDQLAPLDRKSLARVILEGHDVDFPGRAAWEDKLFVAKETYVARSRRLVEEMKSIMENAQTFQDPDGGSKESPQAQALVDRAQRLLVEAKTVEANFKAVMQEGLDQAKQVQ